MPNPIVPTEDATKVPTKDTTKVATKDTTKVATALTLEQISAVDDRAPIDVDVEAWGGQVQIRPLTLQQINECNKRAANPARGLGNCFA